MNPNEFRDLLKNLYSDQLAIPACSSSIRASNPCASALVVHVPAFAL